MSQPSLPESSFETADPPLVLALAKGRILDEALPLLAEAGVEPAVDPAGSRKLVFETGIPGLRLLVVRAQDVPTFVEYGAADLGITGKDVLLEHEGSGVYEPLDLGIATCRLVVARPAGAPDFDPGAGRRPRVATKYVATARKHFASKGLQVDTIKLYGSMEIAPAMGLADWIVDLVDSGSTLAANGLEAHEVITPISSRLIANKVAMKMRHEEMGAFIARMQRVAAGGLGGGGA